MDYHHILTFLLDKPDFEACVTQHNDKEVIEITFYAGEKEVKLLHFFVTEFSALPTFYLYQASCFGQLAHVATTENQLAWICVNHSDSVSVNFESPELAFYESICRHIDLLTKLICDPDFNKKELLREFQAHWIQQTESLSNTMQHLYCALPSNQVTKLKLLKTTSKPISVLQHSYVALPFDYKNASLENFFDCDSRQEITDSLTISIPLGTVSPYMDSGEDGIKKWLCESLKTVSTRSAKELQTTLYHWRTKGFWLILSFDTLSGRTWIGVRLIYSDKTAKKSFPQRLEKFKNWKIEPFTIENFNQKLILPRSGANITFDNKKVMLIGCGSVGGEIAHKIASSGVGHLTLVDPDVYSTSNLYRHRLENCYLNMNKAHALSHQLRAQFPWLSVCAKANKKLLDYRSYDSLREYDLIVIAIGSPTHERMFHSYLSKLISPPAVIYTWLEGYGIGGHAVLDIPKSLGCLRCAYVDIKEGKRGLASNLNFFKTDQSVVKNHAGCGEMFIPYGALHSTQTALIASDLAIQYLEGKCTESKKVSWKGDERDAIKEGIELSDRFEKFNASLKKRPLHHPLCDICNPKDGITFTHNEIILIISSSVYKKIMTFKQINSSDLEAAGLLIGYQNNAGVYCIHQITEPKPSDIRKRAYFKLDPIAHQKEVDDAFEYSEHLLGYLGTWHTHPESIPTPSHLDSLDWGTHEKENPDRALFFIIAGTETLSVFRNTADGLCAMKQI